MLVHLNYFSPPLGKSMGLHAVVPDARKPFPVVYLLHGLSDDYTIWQRRTGVERFADALGIGVVMLDGGKSFYCDCGVGAWERHILESVALVDRTFNTDARRTRRGIGGLSMGGYGAMKIGLRHPDIFGSAHSHSGALAIQEHLAAARKAGAGHEHAWVHDALRPLWPDLRLPAADDPFKLAIRPGRKPLLRIDCGTEDFLIEQNRAFHALLVRRKVAHEYEEHPGGHCWDYWDRHIQTALAFHARAFARKGR